MAVLALAGGLLLAGCGEDEQESAEARLQDFCAGMADFEEQQSDLEDQAAPLREVAKGAPEDIRPALRTWADAWEEEYRTGASSMSDAGEEARDEVTRYYEDNCDVDGG